MLDIALADCDKAKSSPNPTVVAGRLAAAQRDALRRDDLRRCAERDPADWQPATEPVMVRIGRDRERVQCRRRRLDARLFESMTPDQERAAVYIEAAYRLMAGDVRGAQSRYGDAAGSAAASRALLDWTAWQARAVADYVRWCRACRPHGVAIAAVTATLCHGESTRAVDRAQRRRHGWAVNNLMDGLSLYCHIVWQIG